VKQSETIKNERVYAVCGKEFEENGHIPLKKVIPVSELLKPNYNMREGIQNIWDECNDKYHRSPCVVCKKISSQGCILHYQY
jgi:hypothetical protein